ncbi:MAG: hypothetical protein J6T51_02420 [Kiritimatiellae bacterium]|nr:hypothetical protein [Kiritimatiellia bacterium]
MPKGVKVVAYEGGALRSLVSGETGREAVLALPLSRLIVKMVRVPAGEDPVEVSRPVLQKASPFPDEPLTVSCETTGETAAGSVVVAAALPESAADDIAEALDAAKLNVTRVDSLALGQLRGVWGALGECDASSRRVVLLPSADCISVFMLDGDQPSAVRATTDGAEIRREVMLSLLEAEDFGGAKPLAEIVVVKAEKPESPENPESPESPEVPEKPETPEPDFASLSCFAPVREIVVGADAGLVGVAERSEEPGSLNALPDSWAELLAETRFKAKLMKFLAVAAGLWILAMGVLFGVPVVYGFMTDSQKSDTKRNHSRFLEVKKMVDKVNLVRKYSDHEHSALELLKAVSDRLPEDVTLSDWDYRRDKGVVLKGDAGQSSDIYELKDRMEDMAFGDDEDAERVFGEVKMGSVGSSRGGRYRFTLELGYPKEDWQ